MGKFLKKKVSSQKMKLKKKISDKIFLKMGITNKYIKYLISLLVSFALSFWYILLLISIVIVITNEISNENSGGQVFYGLPPIINREMVEGAVLSYKEQGVYPSVTLAQIILESSGNYKNGMSELAYKHKNLFGIKGSGVIYETSEFDEYGEKKIYASFKRYKSYKDSIIDHGEVLLQSRYVKYTEKAKNAKDYARAVHKGGYATAPDYAQKLIKLMDEYNLYRFDTKDLKTALSMMIVGDGKVTGQFVYPLAYKGAVTSRFGYRGNIGIVGASTFHNGIDIGVSSGTNILAADGGEVIHAGWLGTGGYTVIISHKNNVNTYYHHIKEDGILVVMGQKVSKGQVIAKVGSTGASSGAHLHFGIKVGDNYVNPEKYLNFN